MGSSRFVAFYVDGDGNFKPKCKISCPELDIKLTEEMITASNKKNEVKVDGGIVISFGWNSGGVGAKYGFKTLEILLVPHGGAHNDTICVVDQKI